MDSTYNSTESQSCAAHSPATADYFEIQSYDNALAESVNADYKNELVDNGPRYPGAAELSLATAQWVVFYNRERPHSYCHNLTPHHAEQPHYDRMRILNPEEALTI